jgi:D-glycero-D-manno-heptose 1,7-bisphosphate phosphatase
MVNPTQQPKKAVFLDRDGVLNQDLGYVFRTSDLVIPQGVAATLRTLKDRGFLLVVITNQSGVARGMYSMEDVDTFNKCLGQEILKLGGPALDAFYVCPHHPDGSVKTFARDCLCRKPKPGLILQAASDLGINLKESWVIGDKESDAGCAKNAGVRAVLVHSDKYDQGGNQHLIVKNIEETLKYIS